MPDLRRNLLCFRRCKKRTPFLGGSAAYAALASSFYAPTRICGIVGKDFKPEDMQRLSRRGIDTSNVECDPNGDGKLNILDLISLKKRLAEK